MTLSPMPTCMPNCTTALPALWALTATGRGMVGSNMTAAAQQAFGELQPAIARAGLMGDAHSWLAVVPDEAKGPDDPDCRHVARVVFGYAMHNLQGECRQPDVPLSGSLAWWPITAGRYAMFSHVGPYTTLHLSWATFYRDWLPSSGEQLRDVPPMELCLSSPANTPPEKLHTEIWLPVV